MSTDPAAETLPEPGVAKESSVARIKTAAALVGRTLKGQYRIDKELGQGAHGVVFRGTQLALEKPVAIKMLRPDGFHAADALDRFQREATVVSKLVHPSIAQVLDFGIEEGMPFLVMEFVDGKELTDVVAAEGPMPPARAVAIARQLVSALEEAHKSGIVHRDIKPHNIRLMRYSAGGPIYLKVLDFGIAKQLDEAGGHKLTSTGAVMGTPAYMAPEQAGGAKLDARADQYATGIVLYELLTGSVPFTSQTVTGVLMAHLTKPPPELPREVPEGLRKIVMKLLSKDPTGRFESCAQLDRALADCESACRDVPALAAGRVQPDEAGAAATTPAPRQPMLVIAGAFVMALFLVGGVVVLGPKARHRGSSTTAGQADAKGGTQPVDKPVDPANQPTTGTGPKGLAAASSGTATDTGADTKRDRAAGTAGTATPTPDTAQKPAKPSGPQTPHSPPPKGAVATTSPVGGKEPSQHESAETKGKLDEAEQFLKAGNYQEAATLALKTTFTEPTPRAYRVLVTAYCNLGDLSRATTFFHRVAPAQKRALSTLCARHDIALH